MMLIQSSIPSSIEAAVTSGSDHGKQEFTRVWISGDGAWQEFPKRCMHPQDGYGKAVPVTMRQNKDNSSCSPNLLNWSPPSTITTMSETSAPIHVYKRRKIQRNPLAVFPTNASTNTRPSDSCLSAPISVNKQREIQRNPLAVFPTSASTSTRPSDRCLPAPIIAYKRRKIRRNPLAIFPTSALTSTRPSDNFLSASSSDTPSVAGGKHVVSAVCANKRVFITSNVNPTECDKLDFAMKLVSGDEPAAQLNEVGDMLKGFGVCGTNDSCSSSKSNMDLGSASLRAEPDDTGECSSSGGLIEEALREDISEKSLCIALLRSHGVLRGVKPPNTCTFAEPLGIQNDKSCLLSCKICLQSEMTLKMLICDHCEEAFHVSCCNPSIKKIPVDEWLCHSCFRTKLKKLERGSSKSLNVFSDKGKRKTVTSKDGSGPISSILRDTEKYTSKVRVGQEFQAEVPDWSGPKANEDDYIGEAVELDQLEYGSYQGWDSNKPSRVSSIGNWLQCQQVVYGVGEGVDGTICGKWRRAPLFQVQTDEWECFSSVHWDPTHSDCAVPQELDTDQVLKQLKYIEMLRPRLTAKMSQSSIKKGSDSRELTQHGNNSQTL